MNRRPTEIRVAPNGSGWASSVDYDDPAWSRSGDAETFDAAMTEVVRVIGDVE